MLQQANQSSNVAKSFSLKSVNVCVLLRGGQQFSLTTRSNDPLLRRLFQILIDRSLGKPDAPLGLIQIPDQEGRSSLYVPACEIVGIVTEPPLNIALPSIWEDRPAQPASIEPPIGVKKQLAAPVSAAQPAVQSAAPPTVQPIVSTGTSAIATQPEPAETATADRTVAVFATIPEMLAGSQFVKLPHRYLQIDQFLSPEDYDRALQTALTQSSNFIASRTTTNQEDYRQSAILYSTHYEELYRSLREKLIQTVPAAIDLLNLPSFEVADVEMQLTAHNDGCFYRIHPDSGSKTTATRVLTYVYYFYQEPKAFSGGELRLYSTEIDPNRSVALNEFEDIEPRNNSIIFFDSRSMHEVRSIHCPSRCFADSRFTLNGWLRRPA